MKKKHFEAFARRLASDIADTRVRFPDRLRDTVIAANYAAQVFADIASADNPQFDRQRFMKACGLDNTLEYYGVGQ